MNLLATSRSETMAPPDTYERADRAEQYYKEKLKETLEATHRERFVAIEVDSGDYYIAETVREAVAAARLAHPDKYPHVIHIGHEVSGYILGGIRLC
jgi:hypothetical protein